MDPIRLQLFLTLAVEASELPLGLAGRVFLVALQHFMQRHPLAGCMLTHSATWQGFPAVIAVGRN